MDEAGAAAVANGRAPNLVKYELFAEVGHGATATVFRGRDRRLGRDVAVKVVHPHLRDSPEVRHRFVAEARAVAKLRHPNIVEVFDVSDEDGPEQYLVCELLSGTTLRQWIRERAPFPPEVAASIGLELLQALGHAHEAGVVHRDVKPENVLVDTRGEHEVSIKLADFGIAKVLDAQGVTSTGQVLGSPAHMAPEQIEAGDVDARSDLFGVGVLLYECMVGHLPFEGKNPAQVLRRVLDGQYAFAVIERPVVGKQWSAILDRALEGDRGARFQSADEMRAAIERELTRLRIESPRQLLFDWCAGRDGFDSDYRPRIVSALCAAAATARAKGDPLSAAADLNRALAYAPQDLEVRRQIASHLRRRATAKLSVVALSVAALVAIAGIVSLRLRARPETNDAPRAIPHDTSDGVALVAATDSNTTVPEDLRGAAPASTASPRERRPGRRASSVPAPAPSPPVGPSMRTVAVTVRPPFGVFVAIDDGPASPVQTGDLLRVDSRGHNLKFSCADDVCRPIVRTLSAGTLDEGLDVRLAVKPATLIVDADSNESFVVRQRQGLVFHGATPQPISMDGKREVVTIENVERGKTLRVELFAGQTVHAAFAE